MPTNRSIEAMISLSLECQQADLRIQTRTRVNFRYIDSEDIEKRGLDLLDGVDAILVPGGFGERGMEGKIAAVCHARENKIPYLGICLGMQTANHRVRSSCCRS